MKLHWSITHLIVLTIACSMLGMTQFALAGIHPPEPCWTCCPNGPLCDNNPDNLNYRTVVHHTTTYTNTQVAGVPLAAWQWYDVAVKLSKAQVEMDNDGAMAGINLFFKDYAAQLEAKTIDLTILVPALQSLGYQGKWVHLAWAMNQLTQAQRTSMVNFVIANGFDPVMSYATQQALTIYHELAAAEKEHRPVRMPCDWFEGGAAWFTFAAMGSALIGQEELVIPLGFIGATFALAGYMGGC